MEYNKVFQLHLSVKAHDIMSFTSVVSDLSARLVIQLNECNEKELEDVTRFIYSSNPSFEFWIELNLSLVQNKKRDAWLNSLISLLCHLNYATFANKKIISYKNNEANNQTVAYIKSYLETQGFDNIFFVPLKNETIIGDIPFITFETGNIPQGDIIQQNIIELIKNANYPLQLYFYLIDKNEEPEKIKTFAEKLLTKIKSAIDLVLLQKIYEQQNELDIALNNNKDLYSTILTKETYIDFLKSIIYSDQEEGQEGIGNYKYSEMVKIKKFYHFEYEILPLWYKRFGHVIKVLMGKRTFKSLFNDNVKKYKD